MTATLLDPAAPFVRAVLAIIEGEADHEAAIAALVAAERRHGVRILREDVTGSLASVWVPLRSPRPTLREFRALLARFPAVRDGTGDDDAFMAFERQRQALYRDGSDDDAPDEPLFAFLTETSLLLAGADFAGDHWIEFPGGVLSSWTPRAWGHCLRHWARSARKRGELRQAWLARMDHVFFTSYAYTAEPRYDAWCRTALEVIRRKCERQLDE